MKRHRVLVAEDDDRIREGLVDTLESEGYEVLQAHDGAAAVELFRRESPDLVLLDVMMPEKSGYDVCREIRGNDERTPIIMLTAKGEEVDKVVGLQLGADDYVTKPFGIHELLARVTAALRRGNLSAEADDETPVPEVFEFGIVQINRKTYRCTKNGKTFDLTARELKLLEVFFRHPGEVLSRNDLLNAVWGIDYFGTTRTLDQHIAQLRKKIESNPATPEVLTTVHGVGYRFEA
jgi:DNA-binding response OmpR family regulator